MNKDRSFLDFFVDDPRWQPGGLLAGVGALVLYDNADRLLQAKPGDFTTPHYVGAALLLAGALLVLLSVHRSALLSRLARTGTTARGRVTGVKRVWPSNSYVLRYRVMDHSGREIDGVQYVSQVDAFTWQEGDEGNVRFDARDSGNNVWLGRADFALGLVAGAPARSRVSGRDAPSGAAPPSRWKLFSRSRSGRSASLFFFYFLLTGLFLVVMILHGETATADDSLGFELYALLVAGLLCATLIKLVRGMREVAERRRVRRDGVAAQAVVTKVEQKFVRSRGFGWQIGWLVSYRYTDNTGRMHDGESGFLTTAEAARWRVADRCPVYYDPGRAGSSVWAG